MLASTLTFVNSLLEHQEINLGKKLCLTQSPQGSQRRKKEYRIQASGCRFLNPDSLNLVPAFPCELCDPERSGREEKAMSRSFVKCQGLTPLLSQDPPEIIQLSQERPLRLTDDGILLIFSSQER
jgi:hypothetical protein